MNTLKVQIARLPDFMGVLSLKKNICWGLNLDFSAFLKTHSDKKIGLLTAFFHDGECV